MKVEIWSDIQCPFCYIGKRHLEAALEKFPAKDNITIEWKSYQLDPTLPEESQKDTDVYHFLAERKGMSLEQSKKMHQEVTDWAARAGLDYRFDKAVIANSMKAHRIIQLAKKKGLGDAAEETFFKAYFTEGRDLSDATTLQELGAVIGLSAEEVQDALTNAHYLEQAKADIAAANTIGVRGVPFFLFNNKYGVSGAQPVDLFLQALEQSFSEWKAENPAAITELGNGAVCTVDGNCE